MMSTKFDNDIKDKTVYKRPRNYVVRIINDDYTPMDFVLAVLSQIFHKPSDEATSIMLKAHKDGYAMCGIYPKDIAETKCDTAIKAAKEYGYPFLCETRPE